MGALPTNHPLLENNIIMAGLLATDTGPVACLLGKERRGYEFLSETQFDHFDLTTGENLRCPEATRCTKMF